MLDPFYPVVPDSSWVSKLVPVGTKLIQLRIKDQQESEIRRQVREAKAVYMVGDHTDVDPQISAFLREHGAVGLPLYVVYPKGHGTPKLLPTLLTPGIARDALRDASR